MSRKSYIRNKERDYSYKKDEHCLEKRRSRGRKRVGNTRDFFERLVSIELDNKRILVYVYSPLAVREILGIDTYYYIRRGILPKPSWALFGRGVYTEDELLIFGKVKKLRIRTESDSVFFRKKLNSLYDNLTECVDLNRIKYLET